MIRRTIKALTHIEETMLGLIILQMGISVFFQVIMRYVFHSAITWLDELVRIEVVFITFFGASLGIKYGSHIFVGVVKDYIGKPWRNLLEASNNLFVAAYSAMMTYFGATLVATMSSHPHFTPTLRVPKHYLYAMVCVGMGLICIRSIIKACQELASFFILPGREV